MKNFRSISLLAILITLCLFIFMTGQVQAQVKPTLADIQMTNYGIITGNNFVFQKVNVYTTNRLILGGCWTCSNFRDQIVVQGQIFTNKTWFTNLGNTNGITLQFGVQSNFMNGFSANQGYLAWAFFTQGATLAAAGTTNRGGANKNAFQRGFNAGQAFAIDFVVYVSNNAKFATFTDVIRLWCTNVSGDQNPIGKTNYTGDNGTTYGGALGWGWGTAGNNGYTAANGLVLCHDALFCITGQDVAPAAGAHNLISKQLGAEALYTSTPIIAITKTIWSVTLKGVGTSPIPGATITFDIKITNTGGTATGLVIRDTMVTNSMRFLPGSMSNTTAAGGIWETNHVYVTGANAGVILYWTNNHGGAGLSQNTGTHLRFRAQIR